MSVGIKNYEWEAGDDGRVILVYAIKEDEDSLAVPVDLTNYSVRMDIATQITGTRVWTFNSDDDAGASPIDETGADDNEAVLGADGEINILVPRELTLPGGAIDVKVQAGNLIFDYDLFLRGPDGLQKKFVKGTIQINPSITKWV